MVSNAEGEVGPSQAAAFLAIEGPLILASILQLSCLKGYLKHIHNSDVRRKDVKRKRSCRSK